MIDSFFLEIYEVKSCSLGKSHILKTKPTFNKNKKFRKKGSKLLKKHENAVFKKWMLQILVLKHS